MMITDSWNGDYYETLSGRSGDQDGDYYDGLYELGLQREGKSGPRSSWLVMEGKDVRLLLDLLKLELPPQPPPKVYYPESTPM